MFDGDVRVRRGAPLLQHHHNHFCMQQVIIGSVQWGLMYGDKGFATLCA